VFFFATTFCGEIKLCKINKSNENRRTNPQQVEIKNCQLFFVKTVEQHTHTPPFNGPLTTRVSRYQKAKTNQDFTEARASERQWHQLGPMQDTRQITTPAPHHSVFYRPGLRPSQQRQSTEVNKKRRTNPQQMEIKKFSA